MVVMVKSINYSWNEIIGWPSLYHNTTRLRQNGRHVADDIFKCDLLNDEVIISVIISLKFVTQCPINNMQALISKPMMAKFSDVYMRHPAPMRLSLLFLDAPKFLKSNAIYQCFLQPRNPIQRRLNAMK